MSQTKYKKDRIPLQILPLVKIRLYSRYIKEVKISFLFHIIPMIISEILKLANYFSSSQAEEDALRKAQAADEEAMTRARMAELRARMDALKLKNRVRLFLYCIVCTAYIFFTWNQLTLDMCKSLGNRKGKNVSCAKCKRGIVVLRKFWCSTHSSILVMPLNGYIFFHYKSGFIGKNIQRRDMRIILPVVNEIHFMPLMWICR